MSAWLPDKVNVLLPLAPALMLAAPLSVTFNVPLVTASWTVLKLPSTSLTLMPAMPSGVFSLTDCAPGTVLNGLSLAAFTVIPTVSLSVAALLSVLSMVRVSAPL